MEPQRRSVLIFATRRPPYPLDNGARIRSLRLAQGLAGRFEVVLVTFGDGPSYDATSATREELERALPGARVELVPYTRRPPGGARRNVLRRASDTFGHYATPSLRAVLRDLVAEHPEAILHLDDPGVALAGLSLSTALTAYAPHNIEHRIIRDVGRRMPAAHRPFMALEARKIAAEERRACRAVDLCVAVSGIDATAMRGAGARALLVCPNGSDPHEPLPLPELERGGALRLLFVGSLRFWPYAYAVSWFVRDVLPRAHQNVGPIALDVVGEHEEDVVASTYATYHGRVHSVIPHYAKTHALVLPVFEGSGTRLKVVEAALLGRPIISTALGVEGLELREDEHYLRAEDAPGFVAAIGRMRVELETHDPSLDRRCAAARMSLAKLTWPRIARDLADAYADRVRAQPS
jgi:glycosyltransferase involved in cell wall biosynthesis